MKSSGIRTHIIIKDYEVLRCPYVRIKSGRLYPLSSADIILNDADRKVSTTIKKGDNALIKFSYRDQEATDWMGTVTSILPGNTKDQTLLVCTGIELPLSTTCITESWENETPEAIVKYSLETAGFKINRIDSPGINFDRFVASNIPVWQVVKQAAYTCEKSYNINMQKWALWIGKDGANWGDFDESCNIPIIQTGHGLIKHMRANGKYNYSIIETFLMPDFKSSMIFRIIDKYRKVKEYNRALHVCHSITDTKARTHIVYGGEHAGF